MKVYPVPGRLVREPRSRLTPPDEGLTVPDHDAFWLRRLACGDVSRLSPADQEKADKEARAKAEADEAAAQAEMKAAQAQEHVA